MKRVLAVTMVLVTAAAYVLTASGAKEESGARFTVEFDNAFGLVKGGDVKVAGVRAGNVTKLRLDRKTKHALVDFELTKQGFGSLRTDVYCESRPQSLIGEYFVDCRPGKSPKKLATGATIPVEQTGSTIPIDLLNNVLRRPYRERLRIILNELGAGVGGRAEDLNAAIRRGSPALRETDRVLAVLARQNRILRDLTENGDTVLGDLASNRGDVGRFVKETEDAATASAQRRADLAGGLRRLPTFLRELRPTMAELGATADASTPYLRDLNASAGQIERLLGNLGPFAEASRVNVRSLAEAAKAGRPAVRSARPTVAELARTTQNAPELANNLEVVLSDLDDRERAVEPDKRSPGGKGYTGFEAFLQYVFDQTMAINIFDANGHSLKVDLFASECSEYQNADSLREHEKEHPGFIKRCLAALGPNQPGVTTPDPSDTGIDDPHVRDSHPASRRDRETAGRRDASDRSRSDGPDEKDAVAERKRKRAERKKLREALEKLLGGQKLPGLPDITLPGLPATPPLPSAPAAPSAPSVTAPGAGGQSVDTQALLDYLLGP